MQYVMDTPLTSKADYPYVAGQDGKARECTANEHEPASKIQNYLMVSSSYIPIYTCFGPMQTSKSASAFIQQVKYMYHVLPHTDQAL